MPPAVLSIRRIFESGLALCVDILFHPINGSEAEVDGILIQNRVCANYPVDKAVNSRADNKDDGERSGAPAPTT